MTSPTPSSSPPIPSPPSDPARDQAIVAYRKKFLEHRELESRVKKLRFDLRGLVKEFDKTEEDLKAVQNVGQIIGEVLKQLDSERFIVKASSGPRYVVGVRSKVNKAAMVAGTRVALDMTTLTIMRTLPREVDPVVFNMLNESPGSISYSDIGGLNEQIRELREVIELPLTNPELFKRVGIKPPKGVLLYGPPGTGKTLLARALANNIKASYLKVVASAIVDKYIGECFAPGTKILQWTGLSKTVETIQAGDRLMGDDGQPRIVQAGSLVKGRGMMYEVRSANEGRDVWRCTANHVLVLQVHSPPIVTHLHGAFGVRYWDLDQMSGGPQPTFRPVRRMLARVTMGGETLQFSTREGAEALVAKLRGVWQPLVFECTVKEYLSFTPLQKAVSAMFSPTGGVDFAPLPPVSSLRGRLEVAFGRTVSDQQLADSAWAIGMWLTDGNKDSPCVSQMGLNQLTPARSHVPVIQALVRWHLSLYGLRDPSALMGNVDLAVVAGLSAEERATAEAIVRFEQVSSSGNRRYSVQLGPAFHAVLASYGIASNRQLPMQLATESRTVRRALMSGIIDGGGQFNNGADFRYEVVAKERRFLDGVVHLARGLGLSTGAVEGTHKEDEDTGDEFDGIRVLIGGELHAVVQPRLPYKAVPADSGVKDSRAAALCDPVTISPVGVGDFFGFQVDGNRRFLLDDFVVTHNSARIIREMFGYAKEHQPCFDPHTRILMFDYSMKAIKDITLGDRVWGDDGQPRIVTGLIPLTRGQMYRVSQTKAADYIVNGLHTLVLRATGVAPVVRDNNGWRVEFNVRCNRLCRSACNGLHSSSRSYASEAKALAAAENLLAIEPAAVMEGDVIELTVQDWLSLCSEEARLHLRGFQVPRPVQVLQSALPIPPYILGLWLGDGMTGEEAKLCGVEAEIGSTLQSYAANVGLRFAETTTGVSLQGSPRELREWEMTTEDGCGNVFLQGLKALDLVDRKFIPLVYLKASVDDRLQLLAGLIDTDGWLQLDCSPAATTEESNVGEYIAFCFGQTEGRADLVGQVKALAQTVGIRTTETSVLRKAATDLDPKTAYKDGEADHNFHQFTMSDEGIMRVPVRLPRNQPAQYDVNLNAALATPISVEPTAEAEAYCGIQVDGNGRFLLADCTVVHNCVIFMDEVDAIGGRRFSQGTSADREIQRTLMELLNQLDGFDDLGQVKMVMATNRPDTLDPALLRPGRLDRKIEIPIPTEAHRLDILKIHAANISKHGDIDYEAVVKLCEGFNGADLRNVCVAAGTLVSLTDGRSLPIEQLRVGDSVLSYQGGAIAATTVSAWLDQGVKDCVELLFSDGRQLLCTPDHLLLRADGEWVRADELHLPDGGSAKKRPSADVMSGDFVLVSVSFIASAPLDDAGCSWTLSTTDHLDYDLNMSQGRPEAVAFARLPANVLSDGRVAETELIDPYCGHQLDRYKSLDVLKANGGLSLLSDARPRVRYTPGHGVVQAQPQSSAQGEVTYGMQAGASSMPCLKVELVARRPAGAHHVYDITVRSGQSFLANGLVVHNCTEAGMFAIRVERGYVIEEDFMKAARKIMEGKKLEGKLEYEKV